MNKIEIVHCDFSNPQHTKKLIELINCYIADNMGGGEILTKEKCYDLIDGLKNHPSKLVLFAVYQNEIVGLTNCFINFGTFAAKPFINIHDVIVDPKARGIGAGRALMDAIIIISREWNCAKITLEVREDNYLAQNLYKSMGFNDGAPKMFFWTKYL